MFLLDKKTWYAIIKVIQENLANRFLNCVIYAGGQKRLTSIKKEKVKMAKTFSFLYNKTKKDKIHQMY